MKATAAIVHTVGEPFSIEEIDVAEPRGSEVLVRIVGVGMCHTDLVARDGFPVPLPIILGHEGAGIVEAVGAEISDLAPGDHVVLSFDSCAACPSCDDDLPAYCYQFLGKNFSGVRVEDGSSPLSQRGDLIHGNFFGQSSFASYAVAHRRNTVKVDADLPMELLGPLGCGVMTGAGAAVISLGVRPGQSLAIFGGGAVGLSALLGALAVDAGIVIVIEPNAARRDMALELGAAHVIDPVETQNVLDMIKDLSGGGVNHALDTTGIPAVVATAVESTLPHGIVGLVGVPPADAMLPASMMSMLLRGTTVKYITEGDADPQAFIPRMIRWYREGKFPFDRLIRKFPFTSINEAARASEDGSAIKPVLIF